MLAWEHASDTLAQAQAEAQAPQDVLTQAEMQRLEALRARWSSLPECVELEMDLRRLQFARWLVQRGILREGI